MALLDHNGECEIPMAKNKVFEALYAQRSLR